jgi:hypothetical protein
MKSKAVFLLVLFLLHTLVGFGCALGMEASGHKDHDHDHAHAHVHEHKTAPVSGLNFSKQDPCCKNLVNDLVAQSKLVPESGKVQVVLPVLWLPDYSYSLGVRVASTELKENIFADQKERPPNRDIRIVIQSFQI